MRKHLFVIPLLFFISLLFVGCSRSEGVTLTAVTPQPGTPTATVVTNMGGKIQLPVAPPATLTPIPTVTTYPTPSPAADSNGFVTDGVAPITNSRPVTAMPVTISPTAVAPSWFTATVPSDWQIRVAPYDALIWHGADPLTLAITQTITATVPLMRWQEWESAVPVDGWQLYLPDGKDEGIRVRLTLADREWQGLFVSAPTYRAFWATSQHHDRYMSLLSQVPRGDSEAVLKAWDTWAPTMNAIWQTVWIQQGH